MSNPCKECLCYNDCINKNEMHLKECPLLTKYMAILNFPMLYCQKADQCLYNCLRCLERNRERVLNEKPM